MRTDKFEATQLRRRGKSYSQISELLHIPKSTLSEWLGDKPWSQAIRRDLELKEKKRSSLRLKRLNAVKKRYYGDLYHTARTEARNSFPELLHHPSFLLGMGIYWGEGNKLSHGSIRVSNVDPSLLNAFIRFLVEIGKFDHSRIRAWILLYPDLQEPVCKNYWSHQLQLDRSQFTKSIVIDGRHKTRRLHQGVCTVGLTNRYFKEQMLEWLRLFSANNFGITKVATRR